MDWIDEAEREVVERILVLLALLSGSFGQAGRAGRADRIAGLPILMRLPILLALARAEAAAQCWLAGLPQASLDALPQDLPALAAAPETGSWAERLGRRLQALAAVLTLVLARAASEAPSRADTTDVPSLRAIARHLRAAVTPGVPAPTPAPDTS
jgi:hypothetical protein